MDSNSEIPGVIRKAKFYPGLLVRKPLIPNDGPKMMSSAFFGKEPTYYFGYDDQRLYLCDLKKLTLDSEGAKKDENDKKIDYMESPIVEYRGLRSDLIPHVFKSNGFKVVFTKVKEAIIKWNRCQWKLIFGRSRPWCSINHIPLSCRLGCKDMCARQIARNEHLSKNFILLPYTFILPKDAKKLKQKVEEDTKKTGEVPIIIKKPTSSSRGRGISIHIGVPKSKKGPTNNDTEVEKDNLVENNNDENEKISGGKIPNKIIKKKRSLCQYYIQKPMLLLGHKFDLRIYVLITSVDPLRVYVYNDGIVRMAPGEYKEIHSSSSSTYTKKMEVIHTECPSTADEENSDEKYEDLTIDKTIPVIKNTFGSLNEDIEEKYCDEMTIPPKKKHSNEIQDTTNNLVSESSQKNQDKKGTNTGEDNINLLDHLTNVSIAVKSGRYHKPKQMYNNKSINNFEKRTNTKGNFQFDSHQWTLKEFMDYSDELIRRKNLHIANDDNYQELVGDCGNCLCRCKELKGEREGSGEKNIVFDSKYIWNEICRVVKYTVLSANKSFRQGSTGLNKQMELLVTQNKGRYNVVQFQDFINTLPSEPFRASETCFELLGFDIMFCRCGIARLIEVNISPSAAPHTTIDREIKIPMYSQAFNVIGFGRKKMGIEENSDLINSIEEFYRAAGSQFVRVLPDFDKKMLAFYPASSERDERLYSWIEKPTFHDLPKIGITEFERIINGERSLRERNGLPSDPVDECFKEYMVKTFFQNKDPLKNNRGTKKKKKLVKKRRAKRRRSSESETSFFNVDQKKEPEYDP